MMWPHVSSAAEMMFDVGALTTMTPAWVAALMSTLSKPTPARAMTLRFGACEIASSSIFVAERISTALASASASKSAGRSVPSTERTSKSGPRASTVAGESCSARRTTGFDKVDPLRRRCGGTAVPAAPAVGLQLSRAQGVPRTRSLLDDLLGGREGLHVEPENAGHG